MYLEKGFDVTIDKIFKGAAKQICKRTITILGFAQDAYGLYVDYKECSECPTCAAK